MILAGRVSVNPSSVFSFQLQWIVLLTRVHLHLTPSLSPVASNNITEVIILKCNAISLEKGTMNAKLDADMLKASTQVVQVS